jgi:hypothetical protein
MERADEATENATALGEVDRRRIQIFTWGETAHHNGDFDVNRDFYRDLKLFVRDMGERGYYAPIARQHQDDGYTYGRVLDVHATEDGIDATVEFAAGMADKFDAGYLDSWSPSFYPEFEDPHTGRTYRQALRELSFVTVRYLKNLPGASPHYSLSDAPHDYHLLGDLMDNEKENMEEKEMMGGDDYELMDPEMLRALIAEVVEEQLQRYMQQMRSDDDETESGDYSENSDVGALENRIAETERKLQLAEARERVRRDLSDVDDEEVAELAELKLASPTLYERHVERMGAVVENAEDADDEPVSLGESGTNGAPVSTRSGGRLLTLCEQAKASGVERGGRLIDYLEDHGYPLSDVDSSVIERVYSR